MNSVLHFVDIVDQYVAAYYILWSNACQVFKFAFSILHVWQCWGHKTGRMARNVAEAKHRSRKLIRRIHYSLWNQTRTLFAPHSLPPLKRTPKNAVKTYCGSNFALCIVPHCGNKLWVIVVIRLCKIVFAPSGVSWLRWRFGANQQSRLKSWLIHRVMWRSSCPDSSHWNSRIIQEGRYSALHWNSCNHLFSNWLFRFMSAEYKSV